MLDLKPFFRLRGVFRINLIYGWHPLIEGIKRLGGS